MPPKQPQQPKYADAAARLLNPFERGVEPAAGDKGLACGQVKGIDVDQRQVTAVLSTAALDRHGEVVLPSAYQDSLDAFRRNPKFLGGHAYGTRDGRPTSIGTWIDIRVTEEGLVGTAQFLREGDELADSWWRRFEQEAQKTFSVGFIAREWEMREMAVNGEQRRVRHFTKVDLLEVSAVEIPANPEAMLRSAKAWGALMQDAPAPDPATDPATPATAATDPAIPGAKGGAADASEIKRLIVEALKEELPKVLTDQHGAMDNFVREIVAATLSHAGLCQDHDDPEPPKAATRDADVADLLRRAAERLGN